MRKIGLKILSVLLVAVISVSVLSLNASVSTSATTVSDFQNKIDALDKQAKAKQSEITALKNDNSNKSKLKSALESKIALIQQQIDLCNNEIARINGLIATNKAEIAKINQKIDDSKLTFKKRIRAIYMSNHSSNVQILLGADSFSDYLQLAQLTDSISAHDKLMIEKMVEAIEALNAKQAENEELLKQQVSIKEVNAQKQAEVKKESDAIQALINENNSSISENQGDLKDIDAERAKILKQMNDFLASIASSNSGNTLVYDGGAFTWPAPGIGKITSGFGPRWGTNHNGIDISNGSYGGQIVAIADGYVYRMSNSCTHNYKKSGNCCGNGYGNYVAVDHGALNGKNYTAYYAHMTRVVVANGAFVKKGQVLGYIGATGWSTGPHLHFGLAVNGSWVNPMNYFRAVS